MSPLRLVWLLVLCSLAIALAWADSAWGHRRLHGPLWENRGHDAATQACSGAEPGRSPHRTSRQGWAGGQLWALSLMKLVNAGQPKTEGAAALLQAAGQAETQGRFDLAMKVYTLAALLYPDTPQADEARLQRLILEFYLDLGGNKVYPAFKNFLTKLSRLSANFPPEKLREPLLAGWKALERAIDRGSHSLPWLEQALTLWEMQPPGTHPPAAALLLGQLLHDRGLFAEAGQFLSTAVETGDGQIRSRALIELLQLAWASEGLSGFLTTLQRWQQDSRDLIPALQTWPLLLRSPDAAPSNPLTDSLGDLTELLPGSSDPQTFLAVGGPPLWEALLSQPLPASLREYVVWHLARHFRAQADFSRASKLYRDLLAQEAEKETSFFYWDRLGLLHIKEQQPGLAEDIFQTLERKQIKFWQLVARIRQGDVELSRFRPEPAS